MWCLCCFWMIPGSIVVFSLYCIYLFEKVLFMSVWGLGFMIILIDYWIPILACALSYSIRLVRGLMSLIWKYVIQGLLATFWKIVLKSKIYEWFLKIILSHCKFLFENPNMKNNSLNFFYMVSRVNNVEVFKIFLIFSVVFHNTIKIKNKKNLKAFQICS